MSGITAGDLFVNLGIKGSEKTIGAINSATKGLGEAKSMSIEAKAAIVGAMYAMERLFASSGAMGTGLTNFNALTGLSAKQLQQWQYAARQAGVSNSEFTGSLMGVSKAMAQVDLAKPPPTGLWLLSQAAGGIDFKKKNDPFYMMEMIQKGVRNMGTGPRAKAIADYLASSMGISEGVIAAMQRNMFRPDVFAKAPTYSDKEISQLDKANIAWSNLSNKIEMAVGHFNALHGGKLVQEFSLVVNAAVKLAEALDKVAMKYTLFEKLAWAIEQVAGAMNDLTGYSEGKRTFWGDELDPKTGKPKTGLPIMSGGWANLFAALVGNSETNKPLAPGQTLDASGKLIPQRIAPTMPAASAKPAENKVQINQNLHFQHDGKDAQKVGASVTKANRDVINQLNIGETH